MNGQLFGQEEFLHRHVDDFLQPTPTVKVTFAHPLLDSSQHPPRCSCVVGVLMNVEVLQTCLDPRASRTAVTIYRCYQ